MDIKLRERLERWHEHIESLEEIERTYLQLEASEESLYSSYFLAAEGKNVTERECIAQTHPDWIDFKKGLVEAKVAFNKARRELELKQSAFTAEYLSCKTEGEAIQKYPKGMT